APVGHHASQQVRRRARLRRSDRHRGGQPDGGIEVESPPRWNAGAELNEKALIPDPSARPWPKPVEYVYVSYVMTVVFGAPMLFFWALGDEPRSLGTVVLM